MMSQFHQRLSPLVRGALIVLGVSLAALVRTGHAHTEIPESFRVGAYPSYDGSGWVGEAFLDIPDEFANIYDAEDYVVDRIPDFTFLTDWIDFPAGVVDLDFDVNFSTIGDFLDDYIHDVSDPAKLGSQFGNFLIRFSGFLKVTMEDDCLAGVGPPISVDFATMGNDGYHLLVGRTILLAPRVGNPDLFLRDDPFLRLPGMYRIEFTYLNIYDPTGDLGFERAGVELYSWHGGGLIRPAGYRIIHPTRGPGTIVPPRVIYQVDDVLDVPEGDFDANTIIDLQDLRWLQPCFTGPGDEFLNLISWCREFDFDEDGDVDLDDHAVFRVLLSGP